jgi:hypothetical protein
MPVFYLYRIKVLSSKELFLFDDGKQPSEILREVVLSTPSEELREGHIWHIGNISEIDDESIVFAIGRTINTKIGQYDDSNKNFLDEDIESSPYTYAILDCKFQLLAIARKSKLSSDNKVIANQFEKLANLSAVIKNFKREVKIEAINDPE